MGTHNEYNRKENTILCSQSGASAGYISIYNSKIWASDCFSIIPKNNKLHNDYLYYILRNMQEKIYGLQTGCAQPHIYSSTLENIKIPIPSLTTQKAIVEKLDVLSSNIETSKKFISFAKLIIKERKSKKPEYNLITEDHEFIKGFKLLPQPSKSDLYFDIESVKDYVVDGGLEYLFGIYYEENGKQQHKTFWAHNQEEEKNSLIQFFDFIDNHSKKYPDAFIYHYASYEITALNDLTSKYKVKETDLVHYLNKNKFINLYKVARQAILTTEGYSIKDLEKYYNFK